MKRVDDEELTPETLAFYHQLSSLSTQLIIVLNYPVIRSHGPNSNLSQGQNIVFFCETLSSQSDSLHPGA